MGWKLDTKIEPYRNDWVGLAQQLKTIETRIEVWNNQVKNKDEELF